MSGFDFSDIPRVLMQYAVLVFSLTVHECAHAWTAFKLGDPTAKLQGRITLNPIPHMDPIGTVVFPILALFSGIPIIGWANPVPVNPLNLRNPRRDHAIVAALGPGSNFAYAMGFALLAKVFVLLNVYTFVGKIPGFGFVAGPLIAIFKMGVLINLVLALFNLIPVPPLDGGWILEGLVSEEWAEKISAMRPYGFILLLILFYSGIFSMILGPFLKLFYVDLFLGFLGP